MKTTRRIFALLLCIVMCVSLFPAQVFAEEADFSESTEEAVIETEPSAEEPISPATDEVPAAEEAAVIEETVANEAANDAATSGTCGAEGNEENVTWSLVDGTLTISGSGAMADYTYDYDSVTGSSGPSCPWAAYADTITSVIVTDGVTSIGEEAFDEFASISTVTLAGSVSSIGAYAFYGCDALASIDLPEGLQSIGEYAFTASGLTRIMIPAAVENIGEGAFSYCASLTALTVAAGNTCFYAADNVLFNTDATKLICCACGRSGDYTIPSTVNEIGTYAFGGCTGLTAVSIPGSVITIGDSAFSGCAGLTAVSIPGSVITIGADAFSGCTSLSSVVVPDTVTDFDKFVFYGCTSLKSATLPSGLSELPAYTFYNCTGLSEISIPSGVTSIDYFAFYGCSSLAEITIPSGVTEIGYQAFSGSGLLEVTIPASVTGIYGYAFADCSSLTSVTFQGDPPTSYGNNVFSGDTLTAYYPVMSTEWANSTFKTNCGGTVTWETDYPACYQKAECTDTADFPKYSYASADETRSWTYTSPVENTAYLILTFSDSTEIADGDFLIIYDGEEKWCGYTGSRLAGQTFMVKGSTAELSMDCNGGSGNGFEVTAITAVVMNHSWDEGVPVAATCHSYGQTVYTCMVCGETKTENGTELAAHNFENGVCTMCGTPEGAAAGGVLTDSSWWYLNDGILSVCGTGAMPDEWTWENHAPWYDLRESVTAVEIADGITSIGQYAFYYCTALTDVSVPASVRTIASSSFEAAGLTEISIPEGVTEIQAWAFGNTALTSVQIPASVTSLSQYAFIGCSRLTEINVTDGSAAYSSQDGVVFSGYGTTLWLVPAGKGGAYTVPDGVTKIEYGAFEQNQGLTDIVIPASVTEIGGMAFAYSSVTSVTFLGNGPVIGAGAFMYCTRLTDMIFSGSAPEFSTEAATSYTDTDGTVVSEYMFTGDNLTITYPADDTTWTNDVKQQYGGIINWTTGSGDITEVASGTCGSNVTWVLTSDGVLTISGSGPMTDYNQTQDLPWDSYRDSAITRAVIEEGVTTVGGRAFVGCTRMSSVSIAESVTEIGEYAFYACGLTELTLPDSVKTLGEYAFFGNRMSSVTIPANVTAIGRSAFNGCAVLNEITVSDENENFSALDGILYNKDGTTLVTCPGGLTDVTVPDGVTAIADDAFKRCDNLASLTVPASVKTFGAYVFLGDKDLTATFEGSAPTFDEDTFTYVTSITVLYPAGDASWTEAIQAQSTSGVTWTAYGEPGTDCGGNHTPAGPGTYTDGTCLTPGYITYTCSVCGQTYTVPGELGDHDYDENGICRVCGEKKSSTAGGSLTDTLTWKIADNILTIEGTGDIPYIEYTSPWYDYLDEITGIVIGEGITGIGKYAFNGCEAAESVEIADTVTTIGEGAFYDCALKSITIPCNVAGLNYKVFNGCNALEEIIVDPANPDYSSLDGVLYNKEQTELIFYPQNKPGADFTVPETVTAVGDYAFYKADLDGKLLCIIFTGDEPSFGTYPFRNNRPYAYYPDNNDSWTEADLPTQDGLVTWKSYTPGEAIVIASGTCGDDLTWSLGADCVLTISGTGAMTEFSYYDLKWDLYTNYIVSVVIESGVTTIGSSAFSGCERLQDVSIPGTVTSIGQAAFSACTVLTSVTIPASVTAIGSNAFYNCIGLKTVTFLGDAPEIGGDLFASYNTSNTEIVLQAFYPGNNTSWTADKRQNYGAAYIAWTAVCDVVVNPDTGRSVTVLVPESATMLDIAVDEENGITEDIVAQNKNSTGVWSVQLTKEPVTVEGENFSNGTQAVVNQAAAENAELSNALNAEDAENLDVTVNLDVVVKLESYNAAVAGDSSTASAVFSLEPQATVIVTGEDGVSISASVLVSNDLLDTNNPVTVNLYTGFQPQQIIHQDEDGNVIETLSGDDIAYDEESGVCTVVIYHFSTLTVIGKAAANGDCNGDGVVNLKDLLELKKALAQDTVSELKNPDGADIDGVDGVNLKDLLLLKQKLAGIIA